MFACKSSDCRAAVSVSVFRSSRLLNAERRDTRKLQENKGVGQWEYKEHKRKDLQQSSQRSKVPNYDLPRIECECLL